MDAQYLQEMKKNLQEAKEEILRNLANESHEFQKLVQDLDPKDLVDIAADDIDRRTLESIGYQEMKRLNLIDSALSRIHNGRYGQCTECGQLISSERLKAIPYALKCISCQSKAEKKREV